jgi:hypothetical protein
MLGFMAVPFTVETAEENLVSSGFYFNIDF